MKLNADLDLIDAQLFTTPTTANAAQALANNIVIGEIKMFAGVTPPANWKLCDGTVYNNTDIPAACADPQQRFRRRARYVERSARYAHRLSDWDWHDNGGLFRRSLRYIDFRRNGRRAVAYPDPCRDTLAHSSHH